MNNGAQNTFLLNQKNDKSRKNVEKNFELEWKKEEKIYINSSDIGFMHESIFFVQFIENIRLNGNATFFHLLSRSCSIS